MSGNAALAAAKRRRNPVESLNNNAQQQNYKNNQNLGESSLQTNREKGKSLHPLQVVLEHDRQLFELERKLEFMDTNRDSNNLTQNIVELDNIVRNSVSEIRLLKTTIQKQQKTIQELSSMLTSLKAVHSTHNNLINELSDRLNSSTVKTVSASTDMEDTEGGIMKLDISEQ